MRHWTHIAGAARMGAVLFVAAIAGCTISVQPWTKQQPPPPNQSPDGGPMGALMKNGASPHGAPANNEATSQMIKNLNEEQEMRKSLQDQVVSLKKQLKDREDNLRLASFEMDESTKQIKRTREEFRQWQMEMDELRERIHKLEEYRSSAKPLLEEIYRYIDRDKDSAKWKNAAPK